MLSPQLLLILPLEIKQKENILSKIFCKINPFLFFPQLKEETLNGRKAYSAEIKVQSSLNP